jgi:hypothetical protein
MAWPRRRKRRSPVPLVTFSNRGGAETPSSASGGQESGESVRVIWPGTNGAGAARAAGAREAAGPVLEGRVVGQGVLGGESSADPDPSPDELPFWDWSSDPSGELDDPSDAFAPDRPEYPDGPDYPDYRAASGADSARATPGSRGDDRSRRPSKPREPAEDKGLRRPWEPTVRPVPVQADEPRRDGIGQHLGSLAHLSGDPRWRAWQWRAVMATVIMVTFSIVANWLVGLTLAVLAVIADTIIRSRRTFVGPAGTRATVAQRHTRGQLGKLERAGYRALHNAPIPGSDDQIDHLVIGPAGVFAIDSEAWDKRLPVRTKSGKQIWHGPFSMKDRLEHARWESERAATLLSAAHGTYVTVRPAMAVYGPKIPWDVATIRDVDVFSGPKLRRYLRHVARQDDTRLLSDGEIERIAKEARSVFPRAAAG